MEQESPQAGKTAERKVYQLPGGFALEAIAPGSHSTWWLVGPKGQITDVSMDALEVSRFVAAMNGSHQARQGAGERTTYVDHLRQCYTELVNQLPGNITGKPLTAIANLARSITALERQSQPAAQETRVMTHAVMEWAKQFPGAVVTIWMADNGNIRKWDHTFIEGSQPAQASETE